MLVNENPLLAEAAALGKCYKVLDLICEKCMKQRDMNEVLAMKMHYISCIFQKCIGFLKEGENKLDTLIKRYGFYHAMGKYAQHAPYRKPGAMGKDYILAAADTVGVTVLSPRNKGQY